MLTLPAASLGTGHHLNSQPPRPHKAPFNIYIVQQILLNRRMWVCVLLGMASGMPLYVLYQMIPGWLNNAGVSLSTIGLFGILALPYNWKFLWSPLIDRYPLPFLGRRRGWILLTQVLLLASISMFGATDPAAEIMPVVWIVVATALFSATQDIVIDGYRRELLPDNELGLGNAIFVNAYRISSLVPGSLAFILSDSMGWSATFPVVAAFMLIGIGATVLMPEVVLESAPPRTLRDAVVEPFREFFNRDGVGHAFLVLLFIIFYKLGDSMATALQTPFFQDMGYSNTEIGTVVKFANLGMSILGGLIGGIIMLRLSINRSLWVFGVVQMSSILGYAALSTSQHSLYALFAATGFEYLGVGLGTAALTAYIASQASLRFSVTQLALLLSFATLARTFTSATAGFLIEAVGYTRFFLVCFVVALPGMVLLWWVAPWHAGPDSLRAAKDDPA